MAFSFSSNNNFGVGNICKLVLVLGLVIYLIFISFPNQNLNCSVSEFFSANFKKRSPSIFSPMINNNSWEAKSPTNLSHLVFGLLGSEGAWHHRKAYIESWWRPNVTRGLVYLDKAPTGDLLPWSKASPPYRVSDDLTKFLQDTKALAPIMIRMVHGIMEVLRELDHENLRWLVMGDDDSVFFVDNIVDVVARLDHTKYYYLGAPSEFIMSNYWFSFNQGFGGAGFMLSYPLAKALANDMQNCLTRYAQLNSADLITMVCIADIGVNLSPQKGIHQAITLIYMAISLDSCLLTPKFPLMSLHHVDMVDPIFPNLDRAESTRHLMKAAEADQSRMLQQTICHHRQSNWTFSVSWGYSTQIYERIMPRSYLQNPIETFQPWIGSSRPPPLYMFNTRLPSTDPCEAPHVFFFTNVEKVSMGILTTYSRAVPRGLPPCLQSGNHTADFVSQISVFSPATKRKEMDRCECCDIVGVNDTKAELKFRECMINEIIS